MTSLKINSFNARGLGNEKRMKREEVYFTSLNNFIKPFAYCKRLAVLLHQRNNGKKNGVEILSFNHGTNKSKGVAILFPSSIKVDINQCLKDNEGRLIVVDIISQDRT